MAGLWLVALFQPLNLQSYVALVGSPPSSIQVALGGLHSCSAKVRLLHLRFVFLLYHTLGILSRGFSKVF